MLSILNTKHIEWEANNTVSVNYYEIFMDTADDLPTDMYCFSTDVARYRIMQGSLAYDISTGDMYMVNSSGNWVKQ